MTIMKKKPHKPNNPKMERTIPHKVVVTNQGLICFCVPGGWDKKDNLRKNIRKNFRGVMKVSKMMCLLEESVHARRSV